MAEGIKPALLTDEELIVDVASVTQWSFDIYGFADSVRADMAMQEEVAKIAMNAATEQPNRS